MHDSESMITPRDVLASPREYMCTQIIPACQFLNPTMCFPALEISFVSLAAFSFRSRSAHLTPDPVADSIMHVSALFPIHATLLP